MMKTSPQHRTREPGDIAVLPRVTDVAGGAFLSAFVPGLVSGLGIGDLANVVPFRRPKTTQSDAPPCVVDPATRPMPPEPAARSLRFSLALAATVLMHGAAFAAFFLYEPPPLASIGVQSISVEIVVGSNRQVGNDGRRSGSTVNTEKQPKEDLPEGKLVPEEAQKAPEGPMELAAVEPAQKIDEPVEAAPAPPVQPPIEEPVKEPVQETVKIEPDALLTTPEPPKAELKPVETKPVETQPTEKKPAAAKQVQQKPSTKKKSDDTKKKPQVATAPAEQKYRETAPGAGIGRSDTTSNYPGIFRAHLMRFKPVKTEAGTGTATINVSLNASGGLAGVRLVSGSGNPRVDEMAIAMARNASPYPPPGKARTMTVPINFFVR